MAEHLGKERLSNIGGKVYIIRDVWAAPLGSEAWSKMNGGRLIRCEYAVLGNGRSWVSEMNWHPCEEGVVFSSIEPAFTIEQITALDQKATPQEQEA